MFEKQQPFSTGTSGCVTIGIPAISATAANRAPAFAEAKFDESWVRDE